MTALSKDAGQETLLERTSELMGGSRALGQAIVSELDAHDVLEQGLPAKALRHFVEHLAVLDFDSAFEKAVGLSYRTYQRSREEPARHLSVEQSGKAWKFAEILARVSRMLGSQKDAERWLETPAIGLDGRRPIDLMSTPVGLAVLETFIGRLEYGVYT